jgi:hypothetical protein
LKICLNISFGWPHKQAILFHVNLKKEKKEARGKTLKPSENLSMMSMPIYQFS